jgi:hypothetical protein
MGIFVNITSDYIALFIIRRFLTSGRVNPFLAMTIGPVLGITLVILCIFIRACAYVVEMDVIAYNAVSEDDRSWLFDLDRFLYDLRNVMTGGSVPLTSIGALLVHLWLPLFALCAGLLKGLNYFLSAAHRAQWFLKRGKDHPLEAVGFVAAPLMFLGAVAFQVFLPK